jgi:hypothetical protein
MLDDASEAEETFDNSPQTPERVARRAVILAAMTCRASVDGHGRHLSRGGPLWASDPLP